MAYRKTSSRQLYLASNSPRRRELLALCGWDYDLLPARVNEDPLPDEEGVDYVQRLAKNKAYAAANQVDTDGVIIAADTTVVDCQPGGKCILLGKPRDNGEAREMLSNLRGHSHQVHTAIVVLSKFDGRMISDLCTTQVPMRNYTDAEIDAYVASGDAMDKAGAYAIQHIGFHPVEKMAGCFANVMGLPLCHLKRSLFKLELIPPIDIPQACQQALDYHCPVYAQILKEINPDYT